MKLRNTITKLIRLTMAVAAIALIGSISAAGQAETQNNRQQFHVGCIGMVDGQTLRFSVLDLNAPKQDSQRARAQVLLYDAQGNVLARSPEVMLSPGQFRSFDFNRDELFLAGDPETGRLQVRGVVRIFLDDGSTLTPEQFLASIEVVERSGKTAVTYQTGSVGWVKLSPDA